MSRTRSLLTIVTIAALHSVAHATLPTIHVTLHPHLNDGRGWGIENPSAVGLSGATNIVPSDYFAANKLQAFDTSLRYTCDLAVVAQPGPEDLVAGTEINGRSPVNMLPIYDLRNCTSLAPTCSDGVKNQDESGVDCGGTICPPCSDFQTCNVGSDCTSGHCGVEASRCATAATVCIPAHCFDGVQDGGEIGVDCGGFCPTACPAGTPCNSNCDCASGQFCDQACYGCPRTCQ